MQLIYWILTKELGFTPIAKELCIFIKKIKDLINLLLSQVGNFCCHCNDEQDAKNIYNLISMKIQFQYKQEKGDIIFE